MLLLDTILSRSEERLTALVSITEDSSFYVAGCGVPAWIGMEYMAQAVGAFGGAGAHDRGEKPPLGLLIGCQKYLSNISYFPLGSRLEIEVIENVADPSGLGAFDCSIKTDKTLVTGRLSVFVRPAGTVQEFLNN